MDKLIKLFEKYSKQKRLDKFYENIEKNNLKDKFIEASFYETFRLEKDKDYTDLLNFSLRLSMADLKEGYGENNAKRIVGLIYNEKHINIQMTNLYQLTNILKNHQYIDQEEFISQILDMVSQEGMTVGTHIIGTNYGEKLQQEGILLTGHKFVASDDGERKNDVKESLSKNITFFENEPLNAFLHIFGNRGYNNRQGGLNDIMIVNIPTAQLQQNQSDIIIEKQGSKYLNSQYISGYVRINVENARIEDVKQSQKRENAVLSSTKEEWENRFAEWHRETSTSKLALIKSRIITVLKTMLNKTKELPKGKDR